jgi:hypothetical protein
LNKFSAFTFMNRGFSAIIAFILLLLLVAYVIWETYWYTQVGLLGEMAHAPCRVCIRVADRIFYFQMVCRKFLYGESEKWLACFYIGDSSISTS